MKGYSDRRSSLSHVIQTPIQESNSQQFQKREVDIDKIPSSAIEGLKRGDGKAALLRSEDLEDEDNEVWILQCPKNVDLAQLIEGKKILLDNDQPIRTLLGGTEDGREFESMCIPLDNERKRNIATLLPDREGNIKIVSTPLSGYIMLRESIPELPPPVFDVKPPQFHQLPSGLKHRHPVYGVDFTKILCKMETDSDSDLFLKKSKKQKKQKRRSEMEAPPNMLNALDSEYEHTQTKKQKRKDGAAVLELEPLPETVDETDSSIKKSKKKKRTRPKLEVEPPSTAETDFDSEFVQPKSKKHKRVTPSEIEIKFEIETDSEMCLKKSKKHKKNK